MHNNNPDAIACAIIASGVSALACLGFRCLRLRDGIVYTLAEHPPSRFPCERQPTRPSTFGLHSERPRRDSVAENARCLRSRIRSGCAVHWRRWPPAPQTLAGVARQAPKTAAMERPHFGRIIGAWLRAKLMPGQLEVQPARLLNSLADDRRKGTRSTAARDDGNREIPSARSEALQRIGRRSRIGNGRRLRQCA